MIKLLVFISILLINHPIPSWGMTWEERQERARQIVESELEHIRAVKLEQAKLEVIARLELLKLSDTNIYVTNHNSLENIVDNESINTNK